MKKFNKEKLPFLPAILVFILALTDSIDQKDFLTGIFNLAGLLINIFALKSKSSGNYIVFTGTVFNILLSAYYAWYFFAGGKVYIPWLYLLAALFYLLYLIRFISRNQSGQKAGAEASGGEVKVPD
ncbi:MAG: hypothetical protein L6Q59_08300 [Ignavibacteriaceae bacterium]|nr:hypothetical protein [Ignavibacteriaceae bacterium]